MPGEAIIEYLRAELAKYGYAPRVHKFSVPWIGLGDQVAIVVSGCRLTVCTRSAADPCWVEHFDCGLEQPDSLELAITKAIELRHTYKRRG